MDIYATLRKIQVAIEINAKEFKPESKLEDLRTVDVEDIGCGLYLTFRFFNQAATRMLNRLFRREFDFG